LELALQTLSALSHDDFAADELEVRCRNAAEDAGWKPGDFFRPIRVAVTGRTVSPPLFGSMELLGRDRTLARVEAALRRLGPTEASAA
jgi:glutamyl-tRNA synthetase